MAGLQQLEHFVEHPALRHLLQQGQQGRHRFGRRRIELEFQVPELGAETQRTHDANRVFSVALGRVANHAQNALFGVGKTPVIVNHLLRNGVVIHGVHGEITPCRIFMLFAPNVVAQQAATGVHRMAEVLQIFFAGALVALDLMGLIGREVGAEGGDLNHLVFSATTKHHVHDAKALANDERTAKCRLHLLGRGVGGHIEIFGLEPQNQIAHRTAHNERIKATVLQRLDHIHRVTIHPVQLDAVLFHADAIRNAGVFVCALAPKAGDEGFDH